MPERKLSNLILLAVLAVVIVFVPALLISVGVLDAYTAQILTIAGINAMMAISVNVICGLTGQLSLGQAGFMAIGAYVCIWLAQTVGVPLPFAIFVSGIVAAFSGFLIGFPTLKLSGDYLAIVTLGFGEILRVIFVNFKSFTGGANGKRFTTILAARADYAWIVIIGSLVLVVVFLQNFFRSTYGRAILSVREDEIAARSNGINAFKYKMAGFVIAAFIAGIAGGLYAPFIGFIKPDLASFNRSIEYLIYSVLGGLGSVTGSILAAYILTYLQEFLRFLQDYRLLFYPVILILVMLFRPQGMLGTREVSFVGIWNRLKTLRREANEQKN
ncbi:MAG TPA: branched-chain amino acid ABC transporter permease [Treponemataceae bacterium]|nr:branched-chain amino acid ABC transporter permease [Treponema sp.]HOF85452.1 branched-chain amino acid ABC transporter permease [Treponemataceae bacterium]HOS35017.1 branched-chain amino acid ABC transporter permease [Treponemataceae bacterium]HOU37686.1 branched-chain amino acid ABC transporter permease [Treponemataceae bacterium]HPA09725.1 branched-chain amino acid ABC transporter permease [Treponemataceae bacterium]